MPAESPVKTLAEWVEYWGEHERVGLPPIAIARYLIRSLEALTDALRALPSTSNAEAGADGEPESVGAQSLFPSSSEGR